MRHGTMKYTLAVTVDVVLNHTAEQWEEEGRLFDEAVRTLTTMGVELDD